MATTKRDHLKSINITLAGDLKQRIEELVGPRGFQGFTQAAVDNAIVAWTPVKARREAFAYRMGTPTQPATTKIRLPWQTVARINRICAAATGDHERDVRETEFIVRALAAWAVIEAAKQGNEIAATA